jgi:hypothetical protein
LADVNYLGWSIHRTEGDWIDCSTHQTVGCFLQTSFSGIEGGIGVSAVGVDFGLQGGACHVGNSNQAQNRQNKQRHDQGDPALVPILPFKAAEKSVPCHF